MKPGTKTSENTAWKLGTRSVNVSNLDKVFWPEDGLTKGNMLEYYRAMAPVMLPYFKNRPVTLRTYPDGIHGLSHYRRGRPTRAPSWLRRANYQPETTDDVTELVLVDDAAGLIWLANQGSIEFHLWTSQVDDLEQPDQVAFDLDPGDEASFEDVLKVALKLRDVLQGQALECYPKTSGGRGLHVYMPLVPVHQFDRVRLWAKSIAQQLEQASPDLVDVAHGATHKGNQVTFDYAQNSIGRNTAAPYTLRARPGATVSAPLSWDEVEAGKVRPADFTLKNMRQRVEQLGDMFKPVLKRKQRLPMEPPASR
jgi:bifunctional non-homologous end joining protein LigD